MTTWRIVDTWEDFLSYWAAARSMPLAQQIDLWQTGYMAPHLELLQKQVRDYEAQGTDWREIAAERVFPYVAERLPVMQKARDNLIDVCEAVYGRAAARLGLDFETAFVIYVGIGCGAGWATQYQSTPACLLGLENIAELQWHTRHRLEGLVGHELGHLTHMTWRDEWEQFEENERDPLFLLYSEGFAGWCERVILGKDDWHQDEGDWLAWCRENQAYLAGEFLRRLETGAPTRDFFGSWYDIQGHKQTGYYLGHEFIRWLEMESTLRDIARLPVGQVRTLAEEFLRLAAKKSAGDVPHESKEAD